MGRKVSGVGGRTNMPLMQGGGTRNLRSYTHGRDVDSNNDDIDILIASSCASNVSNNKSNNTNNGKSVYQDYSSIKDDNNNSSNSSNNGYNNNINIAISNLTKDNCDQIGENKSERKNSIPILTNSGKSTESNFHRFDGKRRSVTILETQTESEFEKNESSDSAPRTSMDATWNAISNTTSKTTSNTPFAPNTSSNTTSSPINPTERNVSYLPFRTDHSHSKIHPSAATTLNTTSNTPLNTTLNSPSNTPSNTPSITPFSGEEMFKPYDPTARKNSDQTVMSTSSLSIPSNGSHVNSSLSSSSTSSCVIQTVSVVRKEDNEGREKEGFESGVVLLQVIQYLLSRSRTAIVIEGTTHTDVHTGAKAKTGGECESYVGFHAFRDIFFDMTYSSSK